MEQPAVDRRWPGGRIPGTPFVLLPTAARWVGRLWSLPRRAAAVVPWRGPVVLATAAGVLLIQAVAPETLSVAEAGVPTSQAASASPSPRRLGLSAR